MTQVTIQLIEGLERGRVFADLPTPVTIGREDDNVIRLNDERISRFHAKIQEDGGRLILTDLDSTNGTRVNGHPIQMRVLQIGDQVAIGRCLLIYGSHDEISRRAARIPRDGMTSSDSGEYTVNAPGDVRDSDSELSRTGGADDEHYAELIDQLSELFPDGPPEPPRELRPVQKAEISDFLAYAHEQIRVVLQAAIEHPSKDEGALNAMHVDWLAWQQLLKLEMDLAVYLRKIAEPDL